MKHTLYSLSFCLFLILGSPALAAQPVVTDSRIKTFVYNEYDVFNVMTHYGYQTNIEFGEREQVETVSIGDRIAWQIVPAGRRLFIRAMEENAHTNMTVITNMHTYQFDLNSNNGGKLKPSEALAYVIRFYYPGDDDELKLSQPPTTSADLMQDVSVPAGPAYNYQYTFTGPDKLAPLKIYDDGRATYFKLQPTPTMPRFFAVGPDGREYPVQVQPGNNGMITIPAVVPKMVVKYSDSEFICVYNERM